MKQLFAVTWLFLGAFHAFSSEDLRAVIAPYVIVSDQPTGCSHPNMVTIRGYVYDKNGNPLEDAMVAAESEKYLDLTDSTGFYSFDMLQDEARVFMYKLDYTEVAIAPYEFKEGHVVTINFYASDDVLVPEREVISFKPVVYLYSESPLTATVSVDYKGDLTFMYPPYNNEWKINVDKTGITATENEKAYPYLFWEGKMNGLTYQYTNGEREGFVIQKDTVVAFLEKQLARLGLNSTEQTGFITFWAPRMLSSEFTFVQFLVDESYAAKVATLNVSPKPDAMRRVYMLYTPLDEFPLAQVKPQKFKKFERNGFTVVEWGGSQIEMNHEEQ